jgi:hypothetical protein
MTVPIPAHKVAYDNGARTMRDAILEYLWRELAVEEHPATRSALYDIVLNVHEMQP